MLREALRDSLRIDDEDMRAATATTSGEVLTKLAALLPGEVLPFVLDDVRPDDWQDSSSARPVPSLRICKHKNSMTCSGPCVNYGTASTSVLRSPVWPIM